MNYNLVIIIECLFFFIFNFVIVKMILKWQSIKCLCVNSPKKDYIFYVSVFYLIYILVFMFYPKFILSDLGKTIAIITIPITIIYLYQLLNYIKELKNKNCDCVEEKHFQILEWYTYISIIIIIMEYMFLGIYFIQGPEYKEILNNYIMNNRKCLTKKTHNKINKKNKLYDNFPISYVIKKINKKN
jgi:hypothetical protein